MNEQTNSLADGLGTLGRSKRVRAWLVASWPFLLSVLTAAAGWIAHSALLEPRVAASEAMHVSEAKDIAEIKTAMLTLTAHEQQNLLRIGRQAAYATAGFEAYETAKVRAQKCAYAEKYAVAYERMVRQGESPEAAFAALFREAGVP